MISVSEARYHLQNYYRRGHVVSMPLMDSYNCVLAEDVKATYDVPYFDSAAMDGYAIRFADLNGESLRIQGESAAGSRGLARLEENTACRIFTGAPMPEGADTVVMQEKTEIENGLLKIIDPDLLAGRNVRPKASQTRQGELALARGNVLSPGTIGFLASIGVNTLKIFATPRVCILITGNEIVPAGAALENGQVFECNSHSLSAALKLKGITPVIEFSRDDPSAIKQAIAKLLPQCDLMLVTGGVSVGDYDYVVPALEDCGVSRIFHGVRQKPAKPMYAGYTEDKLVFGLPGNPGSVLTAYYAYVYPWLQYFTGRGVKLYRTAEIDSDFKKNPGMTYFVKGLMKNNTVKVTHGQESYRMDGFAVSNCIIELPENIEDIPAGSSVYVIPFY